MDKILVRGARTHNLQQIDVELPRDKLIVVTGLSGAGRSLVRRACLGAGALAERPGRLGAAGGCGARHL